MSKKCCEIVYWKHDDGWDVYPQSECRKIDGKWIPNWFDHPSVIVEDALTKKDAIKSINELHILGVCLV